MEAYFNTLSPEEKINVIKEDAVNLYKLFHKISVVSAKCDTFKDPPIGKGRGPALFILRDKLLSKYQEQLTDFKTLTKLL